MRVMDYLPSNPQLRFKCVMECIGTFILSAGINLSTIYYSVSDDNNNNNTPQQQQRGQPILLFLAFFAAIQVSRGISGGHLNPAVTIAVYLSKPPKERNNVQKENMQWYILSQITGAVIACLLSWLFYNGNILKLSIIIEQSNQFWGFCIEMIATFVFCCSILCQGNTKANVVSDEMISTFIITISLFGCCGIAGKITGGCLNPAIGIAHNVVRFVVKRSLKECKYLWLYVFGPGCGGILAGVVYYRFYYRFYNEIVGSNQSNRLLNEVNDNNNNQEKM